MPEGISLRNSLQGHECPCSLQTKNPRRNPGFDCRRCENQMFLPCPNPFRTVLSSSEYAILTKSLAGKLQVWAMHEPDRPFCSRRVE